MTRTEGWVGRRERGLGWIGLGLVLAMFWAGAASATGAGAARPEAGRTPDAAVFWGPGYVFSLVAPRGFVVDEAAGREHGYEAFVVPAAPEAPDLLIAVEVIRRGPTGDPSAAELAREEVHTYRLTDRGAEQREPAPLETRDGRRPVLSHHYVPRWREHHLSAYFEERVAVVRLFMAVPAEQLPAGALEAFASLVSSYRFVTDRVAFE
ncbi:MAG TPA: hypothetical protein PK668_08585 [Myxococcota bacterium]|nr:hypothetical protein [Myxococcota bacterium]HRY92966.1 hypothetical protein [Myxococcota bacterium]HSA22071.1 hypothetical protein [Myxococcota bacterium]